MIVPTSEDLNHSLERMTKHACQLLLDAAVISKHQEHREWGGRGEYILRLISLEILLKAGALHREGNLGEFRHDFLRLFQAQTDALQDRVRSEFGARGLDKYPETGSPLVDQLTELSENYTKARYVYEASIPFTAEERRERERLFVEGDLPVEEWDIVYRGELVQLLIEELLAYLSTWVPDWFDDSSDEGTT